MNVVCYSPQSINRIYQYSTKEEGFSCQKCFQNYENGKELENNCKKSISIIKTDDNTVFVFCLPGIKTRAQAKHHCNLFVDAYNKFTALPKDPYERLKMPAEIAFHNSRGLNSDIKLKLLSIVGEDALIHAPNKLNHIEQIVRNRPNEIAKAILATLKGTTQIADEYNAYDFLNPNVSFSEQDFAPAKAHTLCVQVFYLYQQDFYEKNLRLNLGKSEEEIKINWSTACTAVSQMFCNCLKYCYPNSSINVEFLENGDFIDIKFQMCSLGFKENEKTSLTSAGYRGSLVPVDKIDGKGMGLFVLNRMMDLNKGQFDYYRVPSEMKVFQQKPYFNNCFVLSFMKRKRS